MYKLLFLMFLFVPTLSFATDYYVGDGQSWTTYQDVADNDSTLQCGDKVMFEAGKTFSLPSAMSIELTQNCEGQEPITITSYGEGSKPILDGIFEIGGQTGWTDMGSNIWKKTISGVNSRVRLDGVEYYPTTASTTLTNERRFYITGNDLYIYSVGDPATTYSSIKIWLAQYMFYIIGARNIIIDDLELKGGQYSVVVRQLAKDIYIQNNTISYWGWHGVDVNGYVSSINDYADNINIINNDIISGMDAVYPSDGYLVGDLLNQDGVNFTNAVANSYVGYNRVDGAMHGGMGFDAFNPAYYGIHNNMVEYNTVTNETNASYVRGGGMGGADGMTTNNTWRFNIIDGANIRTQFAGNNNFIYGNIWKNGEESTRKPGNGEHVNMNAYGGTFATVCHDNVFAFNILEGAVDDGMYIYGSEESAQTYNNTTANNIFINNDATNNNMQLGISNNAFTHDNIITNNLFYSTVTDEVVEYGGTYYDVNGIQSVNSSFKDNVFQLPNIDMTYHPKAGSVLINHGKFIEGINYDRAGVYFDDSQDIDIGIYQTFSADYPDLSINRVTLTGVTLK